MKEILIIRDNSKLSGEVENFIKSKKLSYNVIFSEDDNLPCIFLPNSAHTYKGERGFNFLKMILNTNYVL
jgi:hypothetical protein